MTHSPSPPASSLQLSPAFKLIFVTVVILTIVSLVGAFVAVFAAPPGDKTPERYAKALEMCSTTYQLGFGAIIGLIGGKVT